MPALIFILICLFFVFVSNLSDGGHTKILHVMGHIIIWCSFIGGFFAGIFFPVVWLIGGMIGGMMTEA
jgi:uncharacterized membrane-anchored protein YitT (DUF2179 family)